MSRKTLIYNTARKLIVQNGLYDASIGKIAKEANIPVGSVYTYYKSKEELINNIFFASKLEMVDYIFQPIAEHLSEKASCKMYWERAVDYGLDNLENFLFIEQFANSPLIKYENREAINQKFEKLFTLLQQGISKQILKPMDLYLLHNLLYMNILGTIKYFSKEGMVITQSIKDQLYECCWDSIKI